MKNDEFILTGRNGTTVTVPLPGALINIKDSTSNINIHNYMEKNGLSYYVFIDLDKADYTLRFI